MVVAHNPGLANPEISKIIGEQWRSLSEDDKSKWKALAEVSPPEVSRLKLHC
jgi:HMG box factor